MSVNHLGTPILDDDGELRQANTRAEAEATLMAALADCLQPCYTGAARRRRVRAYLRSHAIVKALEVLEGTDG